MTSAIVGVNFRVIIASCEECNGHGYVWINVCLLMLGKTHQILVGFFFFNTKSFIWNLIFEFKRTANQSAVLFYSTILSLQSKQRIEKNCLWTIKFLYKLNLAAIVTEVN
jgi:hypothetical protein